MRFPSRLIPLLALLVLSVGGACEDKHIGRKCELGVEQDGGVSGTTATISSPALECPSRICILPGAEKNPMGTTSLCTASCENNEDCEGETGGQGSGLCKTGFVCMWPTTTGSFCCQKLCVCRDFVSEPSGGYKIPESCKPGKSTCANVK
jgi:hypothetical protein